MSFNPDKFLILVVDDITLNLQVLADMLEQVGYEVTFATNGQQALERAKLAQPDLILLDLMMPIMSGLEVCKQLKADAKFCEIPIIFLTASEEREHLLEAFHQGAVDYITKPFYPPELLARVRVHLELKYTQDQLKKTAAALEKLAITDPLTGIFNRRHLISIAETEFQGAIDYNRLFSIVMLDIDLFKKINDTYGHIVGDRVLKTMTQEVQSLLRKRDSFGRLGGEEFAIVLPDANLKTALKIAERLRQAIADLSIPISNSNSDLNLEIKITISLGVTTYHVDDEKLDDLWIRSDNALYKAKAQGRNQVCSISGPFKS
ncbi:MAG: diguanylate cyclase [Limnoraphis robusta]|nr:diguanylate cyclase [Limnoraphis robusta]MEA5500645.1 diguanylate cyclase [Limnoraphis robusta BA-68 BA1]MEA5520198.1 diguanylate cyclase [Limnoraphis robusta CCNP1315]MEA5542224.1 diguanylate cyclase [Limnoraphis robusta Tam1]MEA5546748.1 diguanylate cyclase [Limnoraphis robusta CCNP1324]